jgi:hypothetical protein
MALLFFTIGESSLKNNKKLRLITLHSPFVFYLCGMITSDQLKRLVGRQEALRGYL